MAIRAAIADTMCPGLFSILLYFSLPCPLNDLKCSHNLILAFLSFPFLLNLDLHATVQLTIA